MLIFRLDFRTGGKEKANLELLSFVLRERLYKSLRSRGVVYRFSGYLSEGSIFGESIFILEGDFLPGKEKKFFELINQEIRKITKISREDFSIIKDDFRRSLIFNSQTPEQINSHFRIRKFIYNECLDWRDFLDGISRSDFINLTKNLKECIIS